VKSMKPTFLLIADFVLFFIFPLLFWELFRVVIGDYLAMILSTLLGILYSIFRFKTNEKLNFTGICVLLNLTAGLLIDIFSGSALQLLWNNVFYSAALLLFYFVSLAIGKPLYLYFILDLMEMRGYDRQITKELFFERKTYKLFQQMTLIYLVNELIYILCLSRWILKMGVEAYRLDIILDKSLNILLSGIFLALFIYIHEAVNELTPVKKIAVTKARRKLVSLTPYWTFHHFERVFYYFSIHKR
jgi:hypothetical protein